MYNEVPPPPRPSELTVAVLGAGLMGTRIAKVFGNAGASVRVYDPDEVALDKARAQTREERETLNIEFTRDFDHSLEERNLVIEVVPEDIEVKSKTLRAVSAMLPDAVVATNTSGFRITELARFVDRPERFVGTHFFNPADVTPLVEVVGSECTNAGVIDWVIEVLQSVGKTPVRVQRDIPGFIANRLQHALWREALELVHQGVCDSETIDAVVLGSFGPRMALVGPMENADYIGLDLLANVQRRLLPEIANHTGVSPTLAQKVARGEVGRKSGSGLITWTPARTDEVESRLHRAQVTNCLRPRSETTVIEG